MTLFAVVKAVGSVCFLVFLSNISLSQAVCKGSAKYKLTFRPKWTKITHPTDFPPNPHFSAVVGCSHNSSYVMWSIGTKATPGVKLVAEEGVTSEMNKEIDQQISSKTALDKFEGNVITNTATSVVTDIDVNAQYPLVSAISMIAPSPDWYVGVRDYSLCNETTGKWIDEWVRDLPLYDAGTDSGKSFVHPGEVTNPPVPIVRITIIPEDSTSNETLRTFGTFTFEKTFDSTVVPSPSSSVNASADMPLSTTNEVPNPSTSKAKSSTGILKPIMSNATSNVMTTSMISGTTTPSKTTNSGERSVGHLGVFLKLMIFNMFFAGIL